MIVWVLSGSKPEYVLGQVWRQGYKCISSSLSGYTSVSLVTKVPPSKGTNSSNAWVESMFSSMLCLIPSELVTAVWGLMERSGPYIELNTYMLPMFLPHHISILQVVVGPCIS